MLYTPTKPETKLMTVRKIADRKPSVGLNPNSQLNWLKTRLSPAVSSKKALPAKKFKPLARTNSNGANLCVGLNNDKRPENKSPAKPNTNKLTIKLDSI